MNTTLFVQDTEIKEYLYRKIKKEDPKQKVQILWMNRIIPINNNKTERGDKIHFNINTPFWRSNNVETKKGKSHYVKKSIHPIFFFQQQSSSFLFRT